MAKQHFIFLKQNDEWRNMQLSNAFARLSFLPIKFIIVNIDDGTIYGEGAATAIRIEQIKDTAYSDTHGDSEQS